MLRGTALPIPAPLIGLRSDCYSVDGHSILCAVRFTAAIFAPCHFSGVGIKIAPGDTVMNANSGTA